MIVNIVLSAANAAVKNLERPSFIFLMMSFVFPNIEISGKFFSNRRFLSSNTFSNFLSNVSSCFFLKRPPKIFLPTPAANTLVAAVISASPPSAAAAPIAFRPVVIFGISISCSVFCSLFLFFEMIK